MIKQKSTFKSERLTQKELDKLARLFGDKVSEPSLLSQFKNYFERIR